MTTYHYRNCQTTACSCVWTRYYDFVGPRGQPGETAVRRLLIELPWVLRHAEDGD